MPVTGLVLDAILSRDALGNQERTRDFRRSQTHPVHGPKPGVQVKDPLGFLLALDDHGEREAVLETATTHDFDDLFDEVDRYA